MSKLKKLREKFSRKKESKTMKDPWGKDTEIPLEVKTKGPFKIPKVKIPRRKVRLPGLAYIKILISAFVFLNMIFLILGMFLNFIPTSQNAYLMWLFIFMGMISLDHIIMKRNSIRQKKLEKVFKKDSN